MCELCIEERATEMCEEVRAEDQRTIMDLRESNRRLLQRTQQLEAQLKSHCQDKNGHALFQDNLPLELRTRIYKYLLVNPQLGESHWIDESTNDGATFKYGLSPAILQTCRGIYEEAVSIVYSFNTFVIVCRQDHSNLPQSPLTRFYEAKKYRSQLFPFKDIPALKRILRWRIITWGMPGAIPSAEFAHICQSICRKPPKFLEVLLMLSSTTWGTLTKEEYYTVQLNNLAKTLSVFRGVGRAVLRLAEKKDVSRSIIKKFGKTTMFNGPASTTQLHQCRALLTGLTTVERVFEMYTRLLAYAQTFERNSRNREEMEPCPRLHEDTKRDASVFENPFQRERHPVELYLGHARKASDMQSSDDFRGHRVIVVNFLERQYKRIVKAVEALHAFVNAMWESSCCIDSAFGADGVYDHWRGKILSLVQEQAKQFNRDLTPAVSRLMKLQPIFRPYYRDLHREKAIEGMKALHETISALDWDSDDCDEAHDLISSFKESFTTAVEDMVDQYLKIRKARKSLFDFDAPGSSEPPIDIGNDVLDKRVVWHRKARDHFCDW